MNKNLILLIENEYKSLSKTHRIIADIIFDENIDKENLKISNFAKLAFCSPSTIMKFINLFNYSSYPVFLNDLLSDTASVTDTISRSFALVENYYAKNTIEIENLISSIRKAKKVYVFSSGLSRLAAYDFIYKCKYKHKNQFIDAHSDIKYLDEINPNDIVLFISNSGDSKPLSIIAKKNKCNSFLVTNRENSIISKHTDVTINLNNNIEAPATFSMFPKESKYSLIYFFDLLHEELYLQK